MRTSKPISTIAYNSPDYLVMKLEELRKAKRLSEWYFVLHKAEADETKDHIHLFVVPSKMLQSDDLTDELSEFDPKHPDRPLRPLRWQSSKFGDWYLYASHDDTYLASKGESRKYHYSLGHFRAFDDEALKESIREIDLSSLTATRKIKQAIELGMSFAEFVASGAVPVPQIHAFKETFQLLQSVSVERSGHSSHDPVEVDTVTGEVKIHD